MAHRRITPQLTLRRLAKYTIILALAWTVLLTVFYFLLKRKEETEIIHLAQIEAQSIINRELEFMQWLSAQGKVHAERAGAVSPDSEPARDKERDIMRLSGKEFTLLNHAAIYQHSWNTSDNRREIHGYLSPRVQQSNSAGADRWETDVMKMLGSGTDEFFTVAVADGSPFLRYMVRVNIKDSCLRCHPTQKNVADNLFGAITTSIPLVPYYNEHLLKTRGSIAIFLGLWLTGLMLLLFGGNRLMRTLKHQMQAEKELIDSRRRFRFLFEGSPLPYQSLDEEGHIIEVNHAWLSLLGGYHRNEVTGKPLQEFIAPAGLAGYEKLCRSMPQNEKISGIEIEMIRKDGSCLLASYDCRKWHDPQKNAPLILCILQDITERKDIENRLLESEERYRLLIENTLEGILITQDARIRFCSRQIYRLAGFPDRELTGMPFIDLIHPEDRELLVAAHTRRMSGESFSPYLNFRILTRDGKSVWVECRTMLVEWEGKAATLSFINDITERRMLEEQLFVSEKMATIASLAAGVAHELNTPLSAILQSIQVILHSLDEDVAENRQTARECGIDLDRLRLYFNRMEIEYFLQGIRKSAINASKIINGLLEFSRPQQQEMISTDLNKLLDNCLELARADYGLKREYDILNVSIKKDYFPDLPAVACIPMEIEQVILNLLKNAVHALRDNGSREHPQIILRTYTREAAICIEVEDNGPGISKDIQQKIFDPFFTTKEIGVGTGLGLSVSYTIIHEKHHGTLRVESAPGMGAKFIITLPANDVP